MKYHTVPTTLLATVVTLVQPKLNSHRVEAAVTHTVRSNLKSDCTRVHALRDRGVANGRADHGAVRDREDALDGRGVRVREERGGIREEAAHTS